MPQDDRARTPADISVPEMERLLSLALSRGGTFADLYFEHDVLVNLSAFEGFSMSVLEALAAGCVPFCTEIASLDRSVFQDAVNCRLCPVERLERMG